MRNLAIIPARGGSKRIPRKNIRPFLGKPIIAYSIETALRSQLFDEVMVSTDDDEIARIAKEFGANVPFFRSTENANDFAGTPEVIQEVIETYKNDEVYFDYCCCIYPTSALISESRLAEGFKLINEEGYDTILTILEYGHPIQRALKVVNNRLQMIWPENEVKRTQDLQSTYHDAGQFYWIRVKSFLNNPTLITSNAYGVLVDEFEVQDIDNEKDWDMAELKYRALFY